MIALPFWRSLLYVPASHPGFLEKAGQRGADAVILDLEDGVAEAAKDMARAAAAAAIPRLAISDSDVVVRINGPLRRAVRDLEAVVQPGLAAVMLPKVEDSGLLAALDGLVSELEAESAMPEGGIRFIPMIETPAALLHAGAIARGCDRNVALVLGSEDFATAMGSVPDAGTLRGPKLHLAMAARAAGLLAIGLLDTAANTVEAADVERKARQAARHGFDGATCVHPGAVPGLNAGFLPSGDSLAEAKEVIAAMEEALAQGLGATRHRGRMIDKPVYERAKRIVARASRKSAAQM